MNPLAFRGSPVDGRSNGWRGNLELLLFLMAFLLGNAPVPAQEASKSSASRMPRYRIDTTDFHASEADIRAVLDSAGSELWKYFPEHSLEPFVVTRGKQGPIVLYQRNDQREIVVRLDTEKTYWSQYAYQFSHEFCHILCGYRAEKSSNKWFEETLCETASLFAVRAMARTWEKSPPYPNWASYHDRLRDYADAAMRKRQHLRSIHEIGLAAFYRLHEAELRKTATDRELNGAMAVILLHEFELSPESWEAVRWLNASPVPHADESFAEFLTRWKAATPEKHHEFLNKLARLYGVSLNR